jgi:choline-glycine betaine transporter
MTLVAAGGLEALQQMVIVGSAPFLVIVAGVAVAFWRDLSREPAAIESPAIAENGAQPAPRETVSVAAVDAR